jgi:RHS repeat-associated protein
MNRRSASAWWIKARVAAMVFLMAVASAKAAAFKYFTLAGAVLALEDVSTDVDVYYTAMRYNRASNTWNVEASLASHTTRILSGPLILLVESFTGTTGPLQSDGYDESTQAFYDLSGFMAQGQLVPGQRSRGRTLSLGYVSGGSPTLVTRVFARPAAVSVALGLTRTLNEVGQPMPGVLVIENGPFGTNIYHTDPVFGGVTLGHAEGLHTWQFSAPDYLPVWRQQLLFTNQVAVIPNPRLVKRASLTVQFTPTAGQQITNDNGSIQINFPPGAVMRNTGATLTSLSGQTLPAFLPLGWSPLQAFSLELENEPLLPATVLLSLWGTLARSEPAALVRWQPDRTQWEVLQWMAGESNAFFKGTVSGSGAYAVVVPDAPPFAPPMSQPGQPLIAGGAELPGASALKAFGAVEPTKSTASHVPELVTATATIEITNAGGALPSGLLLRGEVSEEYRLRDGGVRYPPRYENFLVGYQRPGNGNAATLHAAFPLRPLFLFGAEELDQARVSMDVLVPTAFSGGVLDTNGGMVAGAGVRVLAGAGDLLSRQAVQLRTLNPTNFSGIANTGMSVVAAFEINLAGVASGHHLAVRFDTLPTNRFLVLGRVIYGQGLYGLQPVERLATDDLGRLNSLEPVTGERLDGVNGAGQYLLLALGETQGVISGTARNVAGQLAAGLPVRVNGQPWLAFSSSNGIFRLLAPVGSATVSLTDPATGDSGSQVVQVTDPQISATTSLAPLASGPRVLSVSPTNLATGVQRVAPVIVEFDKPLNPAGLAAGGMVLLNESNALVPASASLNLRGTIATLLPLDPLAAGARQVVVLNTNLTDLSGRRMTGPNSFSFTTAEEFTRAAGAVVSSIEPVNGMAVMVGSPGIAEPVRPVLLVNETSGASATVLSGHDGSFSNAIPASVDDVLVAVTLNSNNTRNRIPVTRQVYQDGSVGLFPQGGGVEAMGEGGSYQIEITGEAVKSKTVFKVEPLNHSQLMAELQNTPPNVAQVVGGMRIKIQGDYAAGDANVSLPLDPSVLNLAPGEQPEDGAFALAIARDIDGATTYQVVDKLRYQNGRLKSNTLPFLGFLMALGAAVNAASDVATVWDVSGYLLTAMFVGKKGVVATGIVKGCLDPTHNCDNVGNNRILAGALVTLHTPVLSPQPGRIPAGAVYATTAKDGSYVILIPRNESAGFYLTAAHPRYADIDSQPFTKFNLLEDITSKRIDFMLQTALGLHSSPRLAVSHAPATPAPAQPAQLQVVASHDAIRPNLILRVAQVQSLVAGVVAQNSDVVISNRVQTDFGFNQRRVVADVMVQSNKAVAAVISVEARAITTEGVFSNLVLEPIIFSGAAPLVTGPLTSVDTNDAVGPMVTATFPAAGATISPGLPLQIQFNEPIAAGITNQPGLITVSGSSVPPALVLSVDQQTLEIVFGRLPPGQTCTLTIPAGVTDLKGNSLDQDPATPGNQSFTMDFRTAPVATYNLSGAGDGGGVVVNGNYAYTLDRSGTGQLLVYDISNPQNQPSAIAQVALPGRPRDLVLLPAYGFVAAPELRPQTNNLLAVVGGDANFPGFDAKGELNAAIGQYLRIYSLANPASPQRLASPIITRRNTALTKVRWKPPYLAYLESGADIQMVGLIDLQEFLIGMNAGPDQAAAFPLFGVHGRDTDENGDYVGPQDRLPIPPKNPPGFFGFKNAYTVERTTQRVADFDFNGGYCGVVMSGGQKTDAQGHLAGEVFPPCYRTLAFNGVLLSTNVGTLTYPANAWPKRMTTLFDAPIQIGTNIEQRTLVLVSLSPDADGINKLSVIDITLPENPRELRRIPFSSQLNLGLLQSITVRADGLLALATTTDQVLLEPEKLALPNPPNDGLHPAVVGFLPGAGSGNISLGENNAGFHLVNLGGRNQVVQTAPRLRFVQFPTNNVFDPLAASFLTFSPPASLLGGMREASGIMPARFASEPGAPSTLDPPSSAVHYYVLLEAPGAAGGALGNDIEIGLETLNRAGQPLKNKGKLFPPVRAASSYALNQIQQLQRVGCDAPIPVLRARRLSDDMSSPYYNLFLSQPFAMITEKISEAELTTLTTQTTRAILWSGFYLRAFIDPEIHHPLIEPFAAKIDGFQKAISPVASVVAETLPATYIMGPNPPPPGGTIEVPGTFGMISAQNGEVRHATIDMVLPGRRLPIVFERTIGGQDLHDGAFGRGWDHVYDEQLFYLRPDLFPPGSSKPLIVRQLVGDSTTAASGDAILQSGRGRNILFKNQGSFIPPEMASDPLVNQLGWKGNTAAYFLPDATEKGVFDLLFQFHDGQFARLTPDGTQYWYSKQGRLEKIYDRYTKNWLSLAYNSRGELIRITDKSIDNDQRYLEVGYYRLASDPDLRGGLDDPTPMPFIAGRICRLRDYAGRDVRFNYSNDGILLERMGVPSNGANGGFTGRPQMTFLWSDTCSGNIEGMVAGNGNGGQGTPLFVANVGNNPANPVASGGQGAGGAVSITPPSPNTAGTVTTASATGPGGSVSAFTFDKNAFPQQMTFSGALNGTATYRTRYNDLGLLEEIAYPENNSVRYTYDTNNVSLRSRGNLLLEEHHAGTRGGSPATFSAAYAYDARYNLRSGAQTDFNANTLTYALTADGRAVDTINCGGAGSYDFDYSEYGQVEQERTPDGLVTKFTYYPDTGFKQTRTRGAMTVTFEYNSTRAGKLGAPTAIRLPAGASITAEYDDRLLLTRMTRGALEDQRGYDENGNLIHLKRTVESGKYYEEFRGYNQINFLTAVTNKSVETAGGKQDLVTTFVPDAAWRVQRVTYPNGETRTLQYDHLGQVARMDIGGYFEEYARDLNGNTTEVRQKGQLTRVLQYDGYDRLTNVINKVGGAGGNESATMSYYPKGEQKSVVITDPSTGTLSETSYDPPDALGRPTIVRRKGTSQDAVINHTYTTGGSGSSTTIAGPRDTTTTTYDVAGRMLTQIDSSANVTYSPDNNGNILDMISSEGANSFTSSFTYDDLDYYTSTADGVGTHFTFEPRLDGQVRKIYDGLNQETEQEFSARGEMLLQKRLNGVTFEYQFDPNRRLQFVGDGTGAGQTSHYTDATLRITSKDLRMAGTSISYEDPGELNLPRRILLPGGRMDLAYDLQGRVTSQAVTYAPGENYQADFTPDALGRSQLTHYGKGGQYTAIFTYDKLGPLTSAVYTEALGSFSVSTEIYPDGTTHLLHHPSRTTLTYDRQVSGRIDSVAVDGTGIYRVNTYASAENPGDVQLGAGLIHEVSIFDARKRLQSRRYTSANNALLADVRYQYDAADNVLVRQQVHRHGRADVFAYDLGNRLLRVDAGERPDISNAVRYNRTGLQDSYGLKAGFFARTFQYDPGGLDLLLTAPTSAPDASVLPPLAPFANSRGGHDGYLHAQDVDGFARTDDPLGNTTRTRLMTRPPGASEPLPMDASMTYNGLSHLVKIEVTNGPTIFYEYQPNGLLHHRVVTQNGATNADSAFIYDQGRLIEEYGRQVGGTAVRAKYYYADEDSPMAADIVDARGIHRYYYLKDALGSVMAIANDRGEVVERVNYDAWGQPEIQGRDTNAPLVSAVTASGNNELLVMFSETVMPAVQAGAAPALATTTAGLTAGLGGMFELRATNGPIAMGSVIYEEDLPVGFPFGAIVRLRPQGNFGGPLALSIKAGSVVDEWGNANADLQVTLNLAATNGVYYQGPNYGSTAPPRLARSAVGSPFLFHGQYFDYDAGLVYLRSRFYDPYTGLYLQRDPKDYEDSVNPYAFVMNSPTTLRDPSGKSVESAVELAAEIEQLVTLEMKGYKAATSIEEVAKMAVNAENVASSATKVIARARHGSTVMKQTAAGFSEMRLRWNLAESAMARATSGFEKFATREAQLASTRKVHADFFRLASKAPEMVAVSEQGISAVKNVEILSKQVFTARGSASSVNGVAQRLRMSEDLVGGSWVKTITHEGYHLAEIPQMQQLGVKFTGKHVLVAEMRADLTGIAGEIFHRGGELSQFSSKELGMFRQYGFRGIAHRIARDYHNQAGMEYSDAFNFLMRQDWVEWLKEF